MSAEAVLQACRERGWMLATAESCTGGLVAAALTAIPGSSDVVERGFVTYSNTAKQQMLGVRAETLQDFGAVSEQVAEQMANGALRNAAVDVAVSITGVAGPGGTDHKPEGMVCFGLSVKGQEARTVTHQFGAIGRENVRQSAVDVALDILLQAATRNPAM